ncbi:hypothetical protein FOZ62_011905 [Perkinsus olseni]|uniref:K Homology domain-containing protein n=1 Tax=Perkinsus olseni TaxID=32597 RepID=A0A7J6PTT2_PEROL|nr:hypothetical protein FOZ62_011905 [Perkinsus olseni]
MTFYRGDRSASSWARSNERMGPPPSGRRDSIPSGPGGRGLPGEGDPDVYEIKILVPDAETRKIIGYKGETVDRLESHNRIKIVSAASGNFFPGSQKQERAVRLIGRYRDVLRGLTQIVEMTEDPNDPQIYFVVPRRCVPAIIGTKGARVRDINDRYDTKIEVFTDQEYRCAFATDESVAKCALWKERMPLNSRLGEHEKVSGAAMEAVHAMVHAHYDSGPFSYNQRVNYEASGQREAPYRSGRGEPSRGTPPPSKGGYGGGHSASYNQGYSSSSHSAAHSPSSSWNWYKPESSYDSWRRRGGGNPWDTWSEEYSHRESPAAHQRGGSSHRTESSARHGRTSQWETSEEERSAGYACTLREHMKFRSNKSVGQALAVAAKVVKDNASMMPLQSTIVIPDVPGHAAALIIGGQGTMIRELKDSSGANVVVKDRGDGRRNVLISGHLSAVHGAMLAVCELIRLAEERRSVGGGITQRGGVRSLVARMLASNQPSRREAEERRESVAEGPVERSEESQPSKRARISVDEEKAPEELPQEQADDDLVEGVVSQPQSEHTSEEVEPVEIGSPPSSPRGDYGQLAILKPLLEDIAQPPEQLVRAAARSEETCNRQNEKEEKQHRGEMTELMRQLRTVEREGELAKKSLKARLSKAKQEKENCIAKYEKMLEDGQKQLEQQKKNFEERLDRATQQTSSLTSKKSSVDKRSAALKSQNEALRRKLADAETQVKVLLKELQSLRSGGHNRSACSTQPDPEATSGSLVYDSEVSAVMGKPPISQSVIVLEEASELHTSNDCLEKVRSKTVIMEGEHQPVTKRYRSGRPKKATTVGSVFIPEGQSPPRKRPNWNRERKGIPEAVPVAERTRSRKGVSVHNLDKGSS